MTNDDMADEIFMKYLEHPKPKRRQPIRKGKRTRPAVTLTLPIKKTVAYYILKRDMLDVLRSKTKEEKAKVLLIAIPDEYRAGDTTS
jgi:hypothetical protein